MLGSRTSMCRIRCSHSAREERAEQPARRNPLLQEPALRCHALLSQNIASPSALHNRSVPKHTFGVPRLEGREPPRPRCRLPEPLGGTLSPCPSHPAANNRGTQLWGAERKSMLSTLATQLQLVVKDLSSVSHVCCHHRGSPQLGWDLRSLPKRHTILMSVFCSAEPVPQARRRGNCASPRKSVLQSRHPRIYT